MICWKGKKQLVVSDRVLFSFFETQFCESVVQKTKLPCSFLLLNNTKLLSNPTSLSEKQPSIFRTSLRRLTLFLSAFFKMWKENHQLKCCIFYPRFCHLGSQLELVFEKPEISAWTSEMHFNHPVENFCGKPVIVSHELKKTIIVFIPKKSLNSPLDT